MPFAGLDAPSSGAFCAVCTALEVASPCQVCQGPRELYAGQRADRETLALLCEACEDAGPAVCYTCGRQRALGSTYDMNACPACAPADCFAARKIPDGDADTNPEATAGDDGLEPHGDATAAQAAIHAAHMAAYVRARAGERTMRPCASCVEKAPSKKATMTAVKSERKRKLASV